MAPTDHESADSLAPTRRASSKGPASSTVSVASSEARDEDGRSDTSHHRRRMSKLFKKRSGRKGSATPDVPAPPSAASRNQSDDSLGLHKSVASSLLTQDSDSDASPVRRPGISPHHSHAGLLTLSSPLIASETVQSVGSATDATLVDSVTSAQEAPFHHANTINVSAHSRGASPSPVGRLKEAFTPTRRSPSPKASEATDNVHSVRPSTSSGALGGLFGGKKRENKVLDGPVFASPPQLHTGADTGSTTLLRSTAPKRIVTQTPGTPPNLREAPTTFITPPTPTEAKASSPTLSTSSRERAKHSTSQSNPDVIVSSSGNKVPHRRTRSATNPPSKLSSSVTVPLTPHPEEAKTPGGTAFAPPNSGGFFASVFSAAQSAANNLSNTISNSTVNKTKSSQQHQGEEDQSTEGGGEEVIGPESAESTAEKRRPAVETLGSGNLSLAQLGFVENDVSPMASVTNVAIKADEVVAKADDVAASQAVSAAYAADKPSSVSNNRPQSPTADSGASLPGTTSPQRQPDITDSPAPSSVQRQGSIRSRISGGRRRHRGSSTTTSHTIGAAIAGSTAALVPSAALNGNRLNGTGFAVASPKRNRDFHNFFKSVPEDDYLIEDYSAALQKEILLHGRLYISEGHLCFSSNILGWVTNLVISFDEVVSVEKKSTAVLFPNAIVIQTLHARNVFASFLARDSTYDLIIGIWKISHPNLKSSLNGVALDSGGTGDKTEKAESVGSEDGFMPDSDDDVYDEDAEEDDALGSFTEAGEGSVAGSDLGSVMGGEGQRKVSAAVSQAVGSGGDIVEAAKSATNGTVTTGQDFPGTATHGPTECGDNDQHYDKLLIDTTIPAPLGKVYSLMFGPASGVFMRKWLIDDQKSTDLQMEDDKKGLGDDKKSFNYSYIKPLSAPVGPRQTKCNIAMTLEQYDLDKAATVLCSTSTPDVPSGNVFLTKTRYCLMWGPSNSTRLIMTFTVEWTGKSWLKSAIESGANSGQMSYATSLTAALRTAVSTKSIPARPTGKGGKSKKRSKTSIQDAPAAVPTAPMAAIQTKQRSWGMLELLRSLLGPGADILESIFTPQLVIPLLIALVMYSWFFREASTAVGPKYWSAAQRQVAYDEIWRHEESELWKWLEDRVALDRVQSSVAKGRIWQDGHEPVHAAPEKMQEREMEEAIRVTEERLKVLKIKVQKEREKARNKASGEEQT